MSFRHKSAKETKKIKKTAEDNVENAKNKVIEKEKHILKWIFKRFTVVFIIWLIIQTFFVISATWYLNNVIFEPVFHLNDWQTTFISFEIVIIVVLVYIRFIRPRRKD